MRKVKLSLSQILTIIMIMCWTVPLLLVASVIFVTYQQNIVAKTHDLMEGEIVNDAGFVILRIDKAIAATKQLTYDHLAYNDSLQESWRMYKSGKIRESRFTGHANKYLSQGFQDPLYRCATLFLAENPDLIYYSVRDRQEGAESFTEKVREASREVMEAGGTHTTIRVIEDRVYIIRNLYTISQHTKFGTLVLELEPQELFRNVNYESFYDIVFYFNDVSNGKMLNQSVIREEHTRLIDLVEAQAFVKADTVRYLEDEDYDVYLYQDKTSDYQLAAAVIADRDETYKEFRDFFGLILFLLICVIPVFIFVLWYIRKQVTRPVGRMVEASKAIQEGDIGYQIEGEQMPNQEFTYLRDSFNKMSGEVKGLFEYTYQEEMARMDAKILALQSQINPHFLNNTLEMMNWQARMADDMKTSKMIEALSTLLNYSMGRDDKRLCSLREELMCVDAYFYITAMRFGNRLFFDKEIDDSLMNVQVPQLILQPILENAVVHGIEKVKKGNIHLAVFREDQVVYLQVTNTGPEMGEEDQIYIKSILEGKVEVARDRGEHVSLGIRNVNQRIRLIYGEEFGLDIAPGKPGEAVSTIRIPYTSEYLRDRDKIMDKILNDIN